MKEKEITANGERHGENVEKVVARYDENVETIIILGMKKEIIMEDGGCAWMALNAPSVSPSVVAATMFVVVGGCILPPSILSFAALKY